MADNWIRFLAIVTVLHFGAFVVLSVYHFNDLSFTKKSDENLAQMIAELTLRLENKPLPKRHGRADDLLSTLLHVQEQLIADRCVQSGQTCPKGVAGNRGDPGDQGSVGSKGPAGAPGIQGDRGDPGVKGLPGEPGLSGSKGDPGAVGDQGPIGVKGQYGVKGTTGIRGSRGDTGPKGEQGEKGQAGAPGPKGVMGDRGQQGDQGPSGPQGFTGTYGPYGDKGDRGDDAYKLDPGCPCWASPSAKEKQKTLYVPRHGDLTIDCGIKGVPTPQLTVQAIQPSHPPLIGRAAANRQPVRRRLTMTSPNNYTIVDAGAPDYIHYKCDGKNFLGEAKVDVVVTETAAPILTATNGDVTVRGGLDLSIQCTATGKPPPTYTFYKDGVMIDRCSPIVDAPNMCIIVGAARADSGTYECRASNDYGIAVDTWNVTVF